MGQLWVRIVALLLDISLMLYAVLYSFGQGEEGTSFQGMDCDLQQFCENIIPRASYYRARQTLQAQELLTYQDGRFLVNVPDFESLKMRLKTVSK